VKWFDYYHTLASKALLRHICDNSWDHVTVLRSEYVPNLCLSRPIYDENSPFDYKIDEIRIPFLKLPRTNAIFDIDKLFFAALDTAVPNSKNNMYHNHVFEDSTGSVCETSFFRSMKFALNYHGFVPARIFVSEDIARNIIYQVNYHHLQFALVTLVDDFDEKLLGYWQDSIDEPSIPIYRADQLPKNIMYMVTFADFLGVMPIKSDSYGPSDLGLAIIQPLGVAKAILAA